MAARENAGGGLSEIQPDAPASNQLANVGGQSSAIQFLRLLQLADSVLPVGGAAQSFGMESLVADGSLRVSTLEAFLRGYIGEAGVLEAWFCRAGVQLGGLTAHGQNIASEWAQLNAQASALKPARESRAASLMMGRRLMQMMESLDGQEGLQAFGRLESLGISESAKLPEPSKLLAAHYSIVFGYCAGWLGIVAHEAVLAYLQQSVTGLISVCQRLLPLGQTEAMRLSWRMKTALADAADRSNAPEAPYCSLPLLEISSMRHAGLETRMFIS